MKNKISLQENINLYYSKLIKETEKLKYDSEKAIDYMTIKEIELCQKYKHPMFTPSIEIIKEAYKSTMDHIKK